MPSHTSHTPLAAAPHEAYDYLTTPACWHEWHAASLGTVPDTRVPLGEGATFDENIRTAGFRRRLHWRVVAAQRPDSWEAAATIDDGSRVRLRYDFAAEDGGTRFTRTLDYAIAPWWLRVVDALVGRWRIRRESAVALRTLQRRFERPARDGR
ncbi:MAG TPA: SRPBCC family protein [Tahibacter sp.]|nr:SRPBCC family protein [Tahibacter sp.]